MTDYKKEMLERELYAYIGTPEEDQLLLKWWTELVETEEIGTAISQACYSLGNFYKLFQRPNGLFYQADEQGIKLAVWVETVFSTACLGVWTSQRYRHSPNMFRALQLIYNSIFQVFSGILGATKQEKLLPIHKRLGYTVIGKIDKLLDNEPTWLVYLSKEAFESGRLNPERG